MSAGQETLRMFYDSSVPMSYLFIASVVKHVNGEVNFIC